jgi:flagellar assembly protein FliH
MTSLSNLIKSTAYVPLSAVKQLESSALVGNEELDGARNDAVKELDRMKRIVLEKARKDAEELMAGARREAALLLEQARREADEWWEQRRGEDERCRAEIRDAAYAEGLEQGRREAERQVRDQYAALIAEGRSVLEQAHEAARRIVAESEPFLVELACAIAGKIVGRKLGENPEWTADLVRDALKRCSGKDKIVLCVAPSQFAYIQSVRDDLASVIDSQAELMIVPDHSVQDQGCVIKTAFGSVDARVETQLTEIRQALLDLCLREEPHEP